MLGSDFLHILINLVRYGLDLPLTNPSFHHFLLCDLVMPSYLALMSISEWESFFVYNFNWGIASSFLLLSMSGKKSLVFKGSACTWMTIPLALLKVTDIPSQCSIINSTHFFAKASVISGDF